MILQPRPSAVALALSAIASELADDAVRPEPVLKKAEAKLSKLIGSAGFDVLLARSLTLAAREHPALAGVSAASGGRLEGLPEDKDELEACTIALVSHLCELLMKFVGEDLATRVFHDVWPAVTDGASRRR